MTHTPGPWEILWIKSPSSRSARIFADPRDGEPVTDIAHIPAEWCGEGTNARLIAAAPDLLAALKKATHELNAIRARDGAPQHIDWGPKGPMQTNGCDPEYFDALVDECHATISKATGE